MKTLKKFFPLSFKFVKDGGNLAVGIIIYVLAGLLIPGALTLVSMLIGALLGLLLMGVGVVLAGIVGGILGLLGTVVSLYCLAGIVFQILVFVKVIKDPDAEPVEAAEATEAPAEEANNESEQ